MTLPKRDHVDPSERNAAIRRLLAIPEVALAREIYVRGDMRIGGARVQSTPDFLGVAVEIASRPRCGNRFARSGGSCMLHAGHPGIHFTITQQERVFTWTDEFEGDAADAALREESLSGVPGPPTDSATGTPSAPEVACGLCGKPSAAGICDPPCEGPGLRIGS